MQRRIGQLLSRIVPLTDHDVEDILQEQKATRQRFGDAALALGMVQPEHVWKAWIQQLQSTCVEIDLDQLGIDTQALHHVPRSVIEQFRVLPIRVSGQELVVACARALDDVSRQKLQKQVAERLVFVLARPGQVESEIARHFPHPTQKNEAA